MRLCVLLLGIPYTQNTDYVKSLMCYLHTGKSKRKEGLKKMKGERFDLKKFLLVSVLQFISHTSYILLKSLLTAKDLRNQEFRPVFFLLCMKYEA